MVSIPKPLIDSFKNNNVVLFVGAGISKNSGLISWDELLDNLGNEFLHNDIEKEFYKHCDHLEKAQYLYDLYGRTVILGNIRDKFEQYNNLDYQKKIISLPIKDIITTNWDNLLEKTLDNSNVRYSKIWKEDHITSAPPNCIKLVKLHGSIEDTTSIIFSEDDYYKSIIGNNLFNYYLGNSILTSTILMVGYSYRDFDFKMLYSSIRNKIKDYNNNTYIVLYKESSERVQYLRLRGLHVINLDEQNNFIDFIDRINKETSRYSDNPKSRLEMIFRENSRILKEYNNGVLIRNVSALGPLAIPIQECNIQPTFGDNTELEIKCSKNWISILDKPYSKAKLIISLNVDNSKKVYEKKLYQRRLFTLYLNIKKYKSKIEIVDSEDTLVKSNLDIYGEDVCLESIKADVTKRGYNKVNLYRKSSHHEDIIDKIKTFDSQFNGFKENNIKKAQSIFASNEENLLEKFILYKIRCAFKKVMKEW